MSKQEYPIILTRHIEALKSEWRRVSAEIIESCKSTYPEGSGLALEFARSLDNPGKFIRPSIFLFGYRLGDNGPDEKILRLALSFELLHTYLLIHDDIIDASDLRRGVPSMHRLCEAYHKKENLRGDSANFGTSMAVLFGDVISAKACGLWSEAGTMGLANSHARAIFDTMHYDVCWGQYLDIMAPLGRDIPSRQIIEQIMAEKTSKYTIKNPIQSGAIQGGLSPEKTFWMEEFGKQLGIAFQIADDILGVYGEPAITGKDASSDLREGKATFLVWSALESADEDDKKIISDFYTGNDRSASAVIRVKEIFDKYGVREKALAIANEYKERALATIVDAPISETYKEELATFANFVVMRNQ